MTTKDLPARTTRGNRKHMQSATSEEETSVSRTVDQSTRMRMGSQKHSFSIKEFCELHTISRSFFYLLREKGEAPRLMKVGRRTLISAEAAAEWRKSMEHITVTKQRIG
jgi:predicted DNA-binding transcriptional regulator AlpA